MTRQTVNYQKHESLDACIFFFFLPKNRSNRHFNPLRLNATCLFLLCDNFICLLHSNVDRNQEKVTN